MKIIKRTLLVVITLLTLMAAPRLYASDEFTEVLGARYRVTSQEEYNELSYGVTHIRDLSESSTSVSGGSAAGLGGGGTLVANQLYPQQVNLLEVPTSKDIKIVNWSTTTETKWNLNTVKAIAKDYERNHQGWKVIAATNGDFFDINAKKNLPYQTGGASVSGGDYYKSSSGSTVGFTNNGTVNSLIGGEKVQRSNNMKLALYDSEDKIVQTFEVEKINSLPLENQTSVYFANWNESKQIDPIEVPNVEGIFVIEGAEKALANSPTDFYGRGVITSTKAKTLKQGEFALVTNNQEVRAALEIGQKVRVQYEYVGAYAEITDATGAGATLLKDGVAPEATDTDRHPRTMIGKKEDGTIVMAVIDGRQPSSGMYGATQEEMAALMKHYGCVDAFNLDGGGSSTLIIREGNDFRVTNSPSDGRERTDANALLIVAYDPEIEIKSEVSINSIKINAKLIDSHGFDISKIYVKINDETKELVDGEALFENLESNKNYMCNIIIEDSNGEKTKIVTQEKISTSRRIGFIKKLDVITENDKLTINIEFNDPDNSISRPAIMIGDESKYINNGTVTFDNPNVNLKKDYQIIVTYRVDLNNGQDSFELSFINPKGKIIHNYVGYMVSFRNAKINEILR